MKPASIKKFDLFYLGSVTLGLAGFALNYQTIIDQTNAEMAAQGVDGLGAGIVIAGLLLGLAISLAIWFLISVLRIEFVRWILILLTGWSAFQLVRAFEVATKVDLAMGLASTALTVISIYFLFQSDAKEWFVEKRGGDDRV